MSTRFSQYSEWVVKVLKGVCIASPWIVADQVFAITSTTEEDTSLPQETKVFIDTELSKHDDLRDKTIHLREWDKEGIFGVSSPTWMLLANAHYLLIPHGLHSRLLIQDALRQDARLQGIPGVLEKSNQTLLHDKFSLHHELGHLVYYHKPKKNALMSAGIAGIFLSIRNIHSPARTWITSCGLTVGAICVTQYFSRRFELTADQYAFEGNYFTPEEKTIIARQWKDIGQAQYLKKGDRNFLQQLVASHPTAWQRGEFMSKILQQDQPLSGSGGAVPPQ